MIKKGLECIKITKYTVHFAQVPKNFEIMKLTNKWNLICVYYLSQ